MQKTLKAEALIKEVEKRSHIWDKMDPDYHNFPKKDASWKEICHKIYKNWDSSTATEQMEMSSEIKKKWANIRDHYRKYLMKKVASEQAGSDSIIKRYVYAHLLHFLNPSLKQEKKRGEFDMVSFDSNTEEDNDEELTVEYPEPGDRENLNVFDVKYNSDDATEAKRYRSSYIPTSTTTYQSVYNAQDVDQNDDDTLFLLSFRSDMKAMDNDQKVEFKLGMLKLLKQIRNS